MRTTHRLPRTLAAPVLAFILAMAVTAAPLGAQDEASAPAPVDRKSEPYGNPFGTITTPTDTPRAAERLQTAEAITDAAFAAGFSGEIVVDMGDHLVWNAVSPNLAREGYGMAGEAAHWPYASVTKQMLAARIVDELAAGRFSLDTKISEFVPGITRGDVPLPTIRQLLQHRSGLRNPDDTPIGADGWPEFYTKPGEYGLGWCLKGRSAPPPEGWSYNNCDYIVLGAAFEELSFADWEYMLGAGVVDTTKEIERPVAQYVVSPDNVTEFYRMAEPESTVLPNFGAAGALGGTLGGIALFNWSRMQTYRADLSKGGPRAAFWQGDPELGYMALGHWVFEVEHPSCDGPITVSQRKGGIGRYRLENIMLPDLKRSIVFAAAEAGFEFGEIWAREGFLYEAVGQLACGDNS